MSDKTGMKIGRRAFLGGAAAVAGGVATPAIAQFDNSTEVERDLTEVVKRNISSFRTLDWQPYFSNTRNG